MSVDKISRVLLRFNEWRRRQQKLPGNPYNNLIIMSRLYLEETEGREINKHRLAQELSPDLVSYQTALRQIDALETAGLIAFERGDRDSRVRVTEKGRLQFERAVGEFVSRLADQGFVPQRDEIHYFALWANAAGFYIDAFNTQAIIGWTRDEIVGQRVGFMASPDCLTQVRTLTGIYEGMFSQGRNYRIPWTYLAKDGREVRVELHLVPERFGRESVIRIEAHIPFVAELLKSV